MYIHDSGQLGFPNFLLPFEGQLDPQNPWLPLSRLIPWEEFEGHSEGETAPDTAEGEQESLQLRREGRLVVDATCAPADIPYPADTKLLNAAREQSESLIDELHKSRHGNSLKPRMQRRKLRRQWLEFIKLKKPPSKRIRKFKRVLLGRLQRNLGHLEALLDEVGLERLDCHHDKMLWLLFFTLFPAGAVMRFWGLAHAQRFQNPTGVFFLRTGAAERMSLVASQAVLLQPA